MRGSSAIEFEADSILLLHRPAYYGIYQDESGNELHEFEYVKIVKNKYNGIGEVLLKYCHSNGTVEDFFEEDITKKQAKY